MKNTCVVFTAFAVIGVLAFAVAGVYLCFCGGSKEDMKLPFFGGNDEKKEGDDDDEKKGLHESEEEDNDKDMLEVDVEVNPLTDKQH